MHRAANPIDNEQSGSSEPFLHAIARALARQAVRKAVSDWDSRPDHAESTQPALSLNPEITDRK